MDCMGFLPGSCCPHFDGEMERRPAYHRFLASGEIQPGYALDDGVAIHFVGSEVQRIVSSRPDAKAYRMPRCEDEVTEESLSTDYLGG